jgi:hypothetical protein
LFKAYADPEVERAINQSNFFIFITPNPFHTLVKQQG